MVCLNFGQMKSGGLEEIEVHASTLGGDTRTVKISRSIAFYPSLRRALDLPPWIKLMNDNTSLPTGYVVNEPVPTTSPYSVTLISNPVEWFAGLAINKQVIQPMLNEIINVSPQVITSLKATLDQVLQDQEVRSGLEKLSALFESGRYTDLSYLQETINTWINHLAMTNPKSLELLSKYFNLSNGVQDPIQNDYDLSITWVYFCRMCKVSILLTKPETQSKLELVQRALDMRSDYNNSDLLTSIEASLRGEEEPLSSYIARLERSAQLVQTARDSNRTHLIRSFET